MNSVWKCKSANFWASALLVMTACVHSKTATVRNPVPVEARPIKMAVLGVMALGAEAQSAAMLTGVLTAEAQRVPGYLLVTMDDINALLALEKQRDLLGCVDSSCMAEIGGALGVDRILTSSLGAVGTSYVVNLTMIDAKTGAALGRASESGRGRFDIVISLLRRAVHNLFSLPGDLPEISADSPAPIDLTFGKSEPRPNSPQTLEHEKTDTGRLSVASFTEGATIQVSGPAGFKYVGVLPYSAAGLKPGEYVVRLEAPGYAAKVMREVVRAGDASTVLVELDKSPSSENSPRYETDDNRQNPRDAPRPRDLTARKAANTGFVGASRTQPKVPSDRWQVCPVGQVAIDKVCQGTAVVLAWKEARTACPAGYRLPMHEELQALLDCYDAEQSRPNGCRPCGQSRVCHQLFGDDHGRYWTASTAFDAAFVVDFGTGAVEQSVMVVARQVRCVRN